jgi:uncharacterized protein YceK
MKTAFALAFALSIALSGCGPVTTDAEEAAQECSGVVNPNIRDTCMSNYVMTKRAGIDAQWNAIGAAMLSRR